MKRLRGVGLGLALATGAVGYTDAALACPPTPCAELAEALPAQGSTGVPLNAEIRIRYWGDFNAEGSRDAVSCSPVNESIGQLRLVSGAGDVTELSGSLFEEERIAEGWFVAKASSLLQPGTDYTVQALLMLGEYACGCGELEWTTVTSFTTGDSADLVAPAYAGVSALRYSEHLKGPGPCGDYDEVRVWPSSASASNEPSGARYNVYVDGAPYQRFLPALGDGLETARLAVHCYPSSVERLRPGASIEVRAVDLAGNESTPNTPVDVIAECPPVPEAEGTDDTDTDTSTDGTGGTDGNAADPGTANAATNDRDATSDHGFLDGERVVPPSAASETPATSESSGCALSSSASGAAGKGAGTSAGSATLLAAAVLSLMRRSRAVKVAPGARSR